MEQILREKILRLIDNHSKRLSPSPGTFDNGYEKGFLDGLKFVLSLDKDLQNKRA